MIGTIVNTGAIIIGSFVGSRFNKGINEKKKAIMFQAIGLAALAIGISNFVKGMQENTEPVLFIASLVIGGLIGEWIGIEERVKALSDKHSKNASNRLIEGLTTAVLLFCIGTLSILGPIESALKGDNTLLFTNAMLDGITSLVLASTFGIGIILSAVILFLWQGSIYLIAMALGASASPELLTQISIIGGILIFATGINILEIKHIKTINLIPGLMVPVIYFLIKLLFI